MRPFRALYLLAAAVLATATEAGAERVVLFGETLARSAELAAGLRAAGFEVQPIDAAGLARLDTLDTELALIGSETACPPEARPAVTRFLRSRRPVIVVGPASFDYTARPVRGVPLVDLADPGAFEVLQPRALGPNTRFPVEPTRVSTTQTPDGRPALRFRTYVRGMNDTRLQFAAIHVRRADRSVLGFQARGDAYADLLAIEIVDTLARSWITYVPLSGTWASYAISLGDFLPLGWSVPDAVPPQLKPDEVAKIAIGIDARTVWREKAMEFALGALELAEEAEGRIAASSRLTSLRLPFREAKTSVPSWLFNPFDGARRVGGSATAVLRGASGGTVEVGGAWNCPTPLVFHPGVQMGTDHQRALDTKLEREQRRIPLWHAAEDGAGVAELRMLAGPDTDGAALGLFGVAPADLVRHAALRDAVVNAAGYLVRQPRIAAAVINTSPSSSSAPAAPTLRVRVHNPLPRPIRGSVTLDVAEGRIQGHAAVNLAARAGADVVIQTGAVPADFDYARFGWKATLETDDGRREVLADTVDVERALLHALAHHVRTQRQFPDGRLSHHYFGDAYGIRALFGYLDLVRREPGRRERHRDLWAATSEAEIRECGLRWVDMLLARQNEDGSIPMGYGEQSATYNVADGGQIALAMGQIAPRLDEARREAGWQFCRRFVTWAETFYIDEALSQKLVAEQPPARHAQARAGHYGLGSSRGVRNPLGPSWVLPDILGVQVLVTYVDSNPDFRHIADRNVRAYLDAGYAATGYFHAEALTWAWLDATDAGLRRRIGDTLTTTFVPPLLRGREDEMYELGARATLRALPLIYYRRYMTDNEEVRAALLKYVWSFASESSERSMRRLAEAHPKPQHGESIAASKFASMSAIWALELLEPGASLLRWPGFPRGGDGRPPSGF